MLLKQVEVYSTGTKCSSKRSLMWSVWRSVEIPGPAAEHTAQDQPFFWTSSASGAGHNPGGWATHHRVYCVSVTRIGWMLSLPQTVSPGGALESAPAIREEHCRCRGSTVCVGGAPQEGALCSHLTLLRRKGNSNP